MRAERSVLPERCRAPQDGFTPLHEAAEGGHAAVVEQLLAAGAATDAKNAVRLRISKARSAVPVFS